MMSAKIQIDHAELARFLRGPEVERAVKSQADAIAGRAGKGFYATVHTGGNRARAYVRSEDYAASLRQRRDHVVEKALGGAAHGA
jgi:hypothetical protein